MSPRENALSRSRGDEVGAAGGGADLDGADPFPFEPFEARRSRLLRSRDGEEALTEHGLTRHRPPASERRERSGHRRGREASAVGESLAPPEESIGGRVSGEVFPAAGRVRDPTEGLRVSEYRRGWNGTSNDPHKHCQRKASMHHVPEGRDSRTLSDLEAPAEDGGDATQTAAPEEVREMGDTDSVPTRPVRKRAHREGGGQSSRGAHAESLTHRKIVRQTDREETWGRRGQPTGHIPRDGPRPWGVRDHSDARARTRREPGLGPGP